MIEYRNAQTEQEQDRYLVSVEQYKHYFGNGYLKVPGLLAQEDVARLQEWTGDLLSGKETVPSIELTPDLESPEEAAKKFSRVHMLHRLLPTAEWGMLHPRVLDVLEALIGPDVLALQTMLFFNAPGSGGQGWHQDAFYINTYPDTLIGAWVALDVVDEANGCLWVAPCSHTEPIYPGETASPSIHALNSFGDLDEVHNISHLNDEVNTLSKVAARYEPLVPVRMNPGDVLFFHSHLLHRSHPNGTTDRWRRAFVSHYCNGRAWVPWNHGPFEGDSANDQHILARGASHLPYASPKFGNTVRLSETTSRDQVQMMMPGADGMMKPSMMPSNRVDED